MRIRHLAVPLLLLLAKPSAGQVSVRPSAGKTPEQIVKEVIAGNGVSISNVAFNDQSEVLSKKESSQFGTFSNADSKSGFFSSGIILCTGNCKTAEGPNNINGKTYPATVSKTVLCEELSEIVSPYPVNNPAVLEFDFSSVTRHVAFRYIFASEEYPNYSCSPFNDVFGFFVTDIKTGKTANIALIPGTKETVSVNNVHPDFGEGCKAVHEDLLTMLPTRSRLMQFNGYVGPLTAEVDLEPGHTYHMKLAIANVSDEKLESAVFIEALSFNAVDDMGIVVKGNGKENGGETAAPPQTDTLSERVTEGIPYGKLRSGEIQIVALNDPDHEIDINPDDYDISVESEYDYLIDDVTASVEDGSVRIRFRSKSRFCDCFYPDEIPFNVIFTPKVGTTSPEGQLKRILRPVVVPILEKGSWFERCVGVIVVLSFLLLLLFYLRALLKKNRFHKRARVKNSYYDDDSPKEKEKSGKLLRKPGLLHWLDRWFNPFTDERSTVSFNRPRTKTLTFMASPSKNKVLLRESCFDPKTMVVPNHVPKTKDKRGKEGEPIGLTAGTSMEIKKIQGTESVRLGHLKFVVEGNDDEGGYRFLIGFLLVLSAFLFIIVLVWMLKGLI